MLHKILHDHPDVLQVLGVATTASGLSLAITIEWLQVISMSLAIAFTIYKFIVSFKNKNKNQEDEL